MRVVHEGVVKLSDVDVLFLMLHSMLASAAKRLLAHMAPFSPWLTCEIMSINLSL